MSFLDYRERQFNWSITLLRGSMRPQLGCVQCGSRLDIHDLAGHNLSGKCLNCSEWIADGDEEFDELDG